VESAVDAALQVANGREMLVQPSRVLFRQILLQRLRLTHRLAARRGKKRAVIAVAHSILVILYHMLRQRQPYHELGSNFFDQRDKTGLQRRLVQRLENLGYTVELHSAA